MRLFQPPVVKQKRRPNQRVIDFRHGGTYNDGAAAKKQKARICDDDKNQ
jgi:hypothetical protein